MAQLEGYSFSSQIAREFERQLIALGALRCTCISFQVPKEFEPFACRMHTHVSACV